ncbi:hypothetical protein [Bacteroides neonati]|uniref:hypothetical protein n=1 Tax=Bacteroides neonati TaxID=1347393 RepID=UPI0011DDEB71|nr:hypothetical protein [Bacteroides neonati]
MQNRIRCRIYIDQSMYDVTGDLLNWDEIYSKLKRIDYGGVMRSFAGKFEFTRAARDVIRNDFLKKGIGSAPKLIWEERNDEWAWEEVFNYVLDISSYSDDGGVLSISAIDDSVESIIKANKGTQYEYSVDIIKEVNNLLYDGIEMSESVNWQVSGNSIDGSTDVDVPISAKLGEQLFPLYVGSSEQNVGNRFLIGDTPPGFILDNPNSYLIKSISSGGMEMHVDMTVQIPAGKYFSISLRRYYNDTDKHDVLARSGIETGDVNREVRLSFNGGLYMEDGSYLIVAFLSTHNFTIRIPSNTIFTAKWYSRVKPVNIDVVSPVKLLNRLVQSMNGGKEGLIGEIVFDGSDRMNGCKLVAAESIRGISSAKMYTSFTKFCNWMSAVFGYVYEVDGKTIRFKHRTAFYEKEVAIDLGGDVSEFNGSIVSSLIYSRVRSGYDKQDYDSVNGRDEFRFTTEYSTETTLTDNKLDLISPYRADVYGVEFLVQRRGKDTTDSNSDNDVFFICTQYVSETNTTPEGIVIRSSRYELDRSIGIVGVLSPDTMFNVMYSPRSFLIANKCFIGVSTNKLSYASSDGNSEVVIDGVSEKDAFVIEKNKALFMPFEVTIETNIQDFPSNRKGLVRVKNDGYVYSGYIEEAETFHGKSKSNGYKLLVNEIVEEK